MAAYTDVGKAHEIANEVRRLHKQLIEAQQTALLFNSRERLFDMPITNVIFLPSFDFINICSAMPE